MEERVSLDVALRESVFHFQGMRMKRKKKRTYHVEFSPEELYVDASCAKEAVIKAQANIFKNGLAMRAELAIDEDIEADKSEEEDDEFEVQWNIRQGFGPLYTWN